MASSTLKPVTHRRIFHIAVPVVLSNATVPILGAVDTAVVGQLGAAAPIGAVGLGAVMLTAIYWMFSFLRMGTSGMTAQAIGAGHIAESHALLIRAVLIGLAGGFALIILQWPIFMLCLYAAPASAEVETLVRDYLFIRIYSAPAAIAMYGITGWLIAKEKTRAVLVLQLWMNGINIVLDLWFVLGLGWGVQGVAIASLIAELSGLMLALFLARAGFLDGHWRDTTLIFDRVRLRLMAVINRDIMIRSVLLEIAIVSFLFLGAGFDDVTLAANQVLLQFLHITAYSLDGFAFCAEALVGQAFGAKARGVLRQSVMMTSFWGLLTAVLLAVGFAVFGGVLIDVMSTAGDVRLTAREYLPWMVLTPLIGVVPWMLDGVFIGATRTRDIRNTMVVSFVCYVGALLVFVPSFGNHGVWAAICVMLFVRGASLAVRYPRLEMLAD